MAIDIVELIDVQRRNAKDVVDYVFRVFEGRSYLDVPVGMPGQAINPVGQKPRTKEILRKVAEAWLRHHLNDKRFDPLTQSPSRLPDVPSAAADYWIDRGELPPHLYSSG